jgi:DNA-binding GntR family transcriptional regulator
LTNLSLGEIVDNRQSIFAMNRQPAILVVEEPRPLPDIIYQWLRERILIGQLVPGAEIRQEWLARQFGTSRVPIREALSRLQAEGLITLRPRRGFAVTSLDHNEIVEIFELRMVVEEHAMRNATKAQTETDVREVEALIELMESLDASAPHYLLEWSSTNRLFHIRLIQSARRKRLSEIALNLRDAIEPYIRIEANFTGQVRDANIEHRQIFDAFKRRDCEAAARLSREHCESTLKRLLVNIDLRNRNPFVGKMTSRRGGGPNDPATLKRLS